MRAFFNFILFAFSISLSQLIVAQQLPFISLKVDNAQLAFEPCDFVYAQVFHQPDQLDKCQLLIVLTPKAVSRLKDFFIAHHQAFAKLYYKEALILCTQIQGQGGNTFQFKDIPHAQAHLFLKDIQQG